MWPFSRKSRRKATPLSEQPVPNLFMRCPKHPGNYILWGDQGRVYRPVPGQGLCPCRGHPRDALDDYIAMRLRLRKTEERDA